MNIKRKYPVITISEKGEDFINSGNNWVYENEILKNDSHQNGEIVDVLSKKGKYLGKLVVEYAGDATAVIMKHHGVVTYGKDLNEALFGAVYLEEAAKTYCMARIMGPVPELTDKEIADEAEGWKTYGQ